MKKLVALFLCLVLAFSMVTGAYASDSQSLLSQLRNANKGAMTLPELKGNWYLNQISHAAGIEKHGQFGTWYYTQFNEDGSGYIHIQQFLNAYPDSVQVTWKKVSDTEAELVFGGETLSMTYDGEFLSFTMGDGSNWQFVQAGTELGSAIMDEMSNLSFRDKKDEGGMLEGVFKPVALFYGTENGVVYVKCSEETLPSRHLLLVERDWGAENRYSVRLAQSETNFDDVTTWDEAYAVIEDSTRYSEYYYNEEVDSQDGISLENAVLYGNGKEMTVQAFYQQQWKQSYILQMEGAYFICMPLDY